jgi:hypothetical protein
LPCLAPFSFCVDVFARARHPGDYSIIGEVKSREARKFSKDEAIEFEKKFSEVLKLENVERAFVKRPLTF